MNLQVSLGGADEGSKVALVLAAHLLEGNDSSGLLVHDGTKTSLALDDNVGDAHHVAEGREEDNELDGVNVVGDDDKGSLLGLNKGNAVVETVLDEERLLGVLGLSLLLLGSRLGKSVKTSLLLLLRLRTVPAYDEDTS